MYKYIAGGGGLWFGERMGEINIHVLFQDA